MSATDTPEPKYFSWLRWAGTLMVVIATAYLTRNSTPVLPPLPAGTVVTFSVPK